MKPVGRSTGQDEFVVARPDPLTVRPSDRLTVFPWRDPVRRATMSEHRYDGELRMMDQRVGTDRLDLAPLTLDEVDALLAGDGPRLRQLTGVLFPPPVAPPPYMTDPLPAVRERLRARPDEAPWWNWLMFERETRRAVGSVAFGGPPDELGSVLLGYAMYPQFEGHGYATEAVKAMIEWAFRQPGVRQVRTLAPVWNTPALRVAENVGMRPVASDEDDDVGEVLVYAVTAPASVASA